MEAVGLLRANAERGWKGWVKVLLMAVLRMCNQQWEWRGQEREQEHTDKLFRREVTAMVRSTGAVPAPPPLAAAVVQQEGKA